MALFQSGDLAGTPHYATLCVKSHNVEPHMRDMDLLANMKQYSTCLQCIFSLVTRTKWLVKVWYHDLCRSTYTASTNVCEHLLSLEDWLKLGNFDTF
jgi:hypothetical protein